MDEKNVKDIELFIADNEENIVRDIGRLVAVNSVEGTAEVGAPFGRGPAEALSVGLRIASELGLETVNCDDMIGYAKLGDAEDYLATITHLDVVPAGEGWTGDPFRLRERDGFLIGRGVMDDKGPSVLCLYALKYLKERNIPLRYSVRAILGINEETGMNDVVYYLDNNKAPVFCFSPDSNFPVCVGEKGIYRGRILANCKTDKVVNIWGGVAANVIPGKCEALVKAEKLESSERVEAVFDAEKKLWHLTASGIGGHASLPAGTVNAIGVMVNYLLDSGILCGDEEELFKLLGMLHSAWDGSALGVAADDGLFEPLTIVGGVIGVKDGYIFQTVDCRYPTNTDGEKIAEGIGAKAGDIAQMVMDSDAVPFYIGLDNPAAKVCMDVYKAVTGESAKPYTMGGGTYARDFPNAASFGPEHPERPRPDFAGPIHGADEAASRAELMEALKVYILALLELEKLDF